MEDDSPFLRSLKAVMTGALGAQELLRAVVREAAEDLLGRVAQVHALDYGALVDRFRDAVVEAHTHMTAARECRGTTKRRGT